MKFNLLEKKDGKIYVDTKLAVFMFESHGIPPEMTAELVKDKLKISIKGRSHEHGNIK